MNIPEYLRNRVTLGCILAIATAGYILCRAVPELVLFLVGGSFALVFLAVFGLLAFSALLELRTYRKVDMRNFFYGEFDPEDGPSKLKDGGTDATTAAEGQ